MATIEQVKRLIKSFSESNNEEFYATALQIAAHEAKLGNTDTAQEIKKLIEEKRNNVIVSNNEKQGLLKISPTSHITLSELVVNDIALEQINRIIFEYKNKNKLQSCGLENTRKLLLEGPTGTGKTFTATVIASILSLPIYVLPINLMVAKYTDISGKLQQIFENIKVVRGVYLFDGFEALCSNKNNDIEVGQLQKAFTIFQHFLEGQECADSLIIATTNNLEFLNSQFLKGFDEVIHYTMPTDQEIKKLFKLKLDLFEREIAITDNIVKAAKNLSQAEIVKICNEAIKASILFKESIREANIIALLQKR